MVYAEGVEDNREDFGPRTIHGAIWQKNHWAPFAWMSTGRAFDGGSHDLDLVAVEDVLESEGAV